MDGETELVSERKVSLAPDLRGLSERATRAWVEEMAVQPLEDGYVVESGSGNVYLVDAEAGACSCPDHRMRGETCKHLRRVALEITARRVPPPGAQRRACVACGTETFADREADPPVLCSTCRLDPGAVVLDRETGDRLVVVRVTDRRADDVAITEAETTVADYPTNDGYPADDLVVEAVYLEDASRTDEPRQYAFPRSRLRPTDDAALLE